MKNIKNFTSPQKLPYEPTGLEEEIAHAIHGGLRLFELKNLEEISKYKYAVHPDGILVYDEKAGLLWFENFCSDEVPISIEGKFDNIELYFDHVRVKQSNVEQGILLNGKSLIHPESEDSLENPYFISETYKYLVEKMKSSQYEKEFNKTFPKGAEVLAYHPAGMIVSSEGKLSFFITETIKKGQ